MTVQDKIPEEAWSGTNTSVSQLRIFGYVSFSHIPDELRRNLDKKSEHCIFTGYSEQHKAYKLYNPITKNLVVRRDINSLKTNAGVILQTYNMKNAHISEIYLSYFQHWKYISKKKQ